MSEQETRLCNQCANPDNKGVHSCGSMGVGIQTKELIFALESAAQRAEAASAYIVGTCPACGKQYDSRAGHECTPRPNPEERLAALEVSVQRIEAQLLEGRPTPPVVFPWTAGAPTVKAASGACVDGMTLAEHHELDHGRPHPLLKILGEGSRNAEDVIRDAHPAVGVATVDGKATCPKCPESVESRATYARVPEHKALTPSEPAPRLPVVTRSREELAVMYDGPRPAGVTMEYVPPTPAEAAIFERGGYVPGEIRIVPDPTVREGEMRATAYPTERGSSERVAAVIRGMDRPTCAHVPPGMSGLCHACRPPVVGLVVGPCVCGTQTPHAPMHVCGPVETRTPPVQCSCPPAPFRHLGCPVHAPMYAAPPTPAAMLGEAVELAMRARALVIAAKGQTKYDQGMYERADGYLTDVEETLRELKADTEKRESER